MTCGGFLKQGYEAVEADFMDPTSGSHGRCFATKGSAAAAYIPRFVIASTAAFCSTAVDLLACLTEWKDVVFTKARPASNGAVEKRPNTY